MKYKKIKIIITAVMLCNGLAFGQMRLIDFDSSPSGNINAGDEITNQYASWGVNFEYVQSATSKSGLELWAFDSGANQNGIDDDLETPGDGGGIGAGNTVGDWASGSYMFGDSLGAGNVLIIQEKGNSTPDDDAKGGIMNITFDNPVTFNDIGILDMDDGNQSKIRFYGMLGTMIGSEYSINDLGNNSYQEVAFNTLGVKRMEIHFQSSGGITGLKYTNVIPEPSTYALIFGGFALGFVILRKRIQRT